MKNISIYLHQSFVNREKSQKKWLINFIERLNRSFNTYNIDLVKVYHDQETFLSEVDNPGNFAYIPIIDLNFINSEQDIKAFRHLNDLFINTPSRKVFTLSLIEEVIPLNYAEFQPFYNFFNQGYISGKTESNISQFKLPGNNNDQSFQYHINNIAKEINYLIIKQGQSNNGEPGIYIANTTPDLEQSMENLSNFLINQGIPVNTPIKPGLLPYEFAEKKVLRKMKNCFLSVHSFGNKPMQKEQYFSNDIPICELENEISCNIKNKSDNEGDNQYFKRILWLPKPLSPSSHEARLIERIKRNSNNTTTILTCTLEELKKIIIDNKLKNDQSVNNPRTDDKTILEYSPRYNETSLKESVYVLYEKSYECKIEKLSSIFMEKGLNIITQEIISNEENYLEIRDQVLKHCGGIAILTSTWNSAWFKSNINEIRKILSYTGNDNLKFQCIVSKEIEQLPPDLEDKFIFYKIPDNLSSDHFSNLSQIV